MLRLHQRFYYHLKPFIPWRLRMALRRTAARRKLAHCRHEWPISEPAGRRPAGWQGWPDDKRFAFIITHDVEGSAGLAKCARLAEVEESLGFRSAFNFVPEGEYRVAPEFRANLSARGFEVGVHDLRHDGKLFESEERFRDNAARINHYLHEWGAAGYRSGFMLRNLDWLHQLEVKYDASTFDTDPFEVQPDGAGTIFPFWIPAPHAGSREGYVELPYTLPQDSTLYLLLRQTTSEIWRTKIDWLAERGGMVLVNVHPDYIQFDGEAPSPRTYPVRFYTEMLEHIRDKYSGQYWQALPRDVAAYAGQPNRRVQVHKPRRIAMVTHSFYESDNRVTRYAEALAARGDHVDVLALRRAPGLPAHEVIEGVHVHRLQDRFGKTERSKLSYMWPMLRFLWRSGLWITRRHHQRRYDLLHIHNMPDFLVFAGWLPRLTGARIILDIHDIVPEFYANKFKSGETSITTSLLKLVELASAHFAHHIIVSNHLWLEKFQARTGTAGRSSVFINNVDTKIFARQPRTRQDDRQIVIFPGGLQWHQGLDIALRAFKTVSAALPRAEFHIYGDGNMKPALVALAAELGLGDKVKFFDPVGVRAVSRIMADADLGVVPKRADSFGNEAYSTKIMEFMSLGVPAVVSKTKIDQYYFNDSVVRFFESGNVDALAAAMIEVLQDPALRSRLVANALAYAEEHSWTKRKADYLRIVDELIAPGSEPDAVRPASDVSSGSLPGATPRPAQTI